MNEEKEKVNLLIFLASAMEQGEFDISEALKIFNEKEGLDYNKKAFMNLISTINTDYLDTIIFDDLCDEFGISVSWPNKKGDKINYSLEIAISDEIKPLMKMCSISEKDLVDVFGIDLENDLPLEACRKIDLKLSNEEFLLKYLGYDIGKYQVASDVRGTWQTPLKIEGRNGNKKVSQVTNLKRSIKIIKRKNPIFIVNQDDVTEFYKELCKQNNKAPFEMFDVEKNINYQLGKDNLVLNPDKAIVIPGIEAHIGKLGTIADLEDYSLKHAMSRIKEIVINIVKYQQFYKASSIFMGVGNDFLNSDNPFDTTTKGTPQRNDTRYKEMYLHGKVAMVRTIETLKAYVDKIYLKYMPGNHDESSMLNMYSNLYDIYNITKDPKVEINSTFKDIRDMTGHVFGDYLLVFCHGQRPNGKPLNDKSLIEQTHNYFPEETRKTKKTYIFAGHLHTFSVSVFSNGNVMRNNAATGLDSWHVDNGYTSGIQGHNIFGIDKKRGLESTQLITIDKTKKTPSIKRNSSTSIPEAVEKALNLTPDSVEKELNSDENKYYDKYLNEEKIKYFQKINDLLEVLGLDIETIASETVEELIDRIGYEQVSDHVKNLQGQSKIYRA